MTQAPTQPATSHDRDPAGAAVAVLLEAERVYFGGGDGDRSEVVEQPIPPSAIVPRFAGEALDADLGWPAHPRGCGDTWPREAQVVQGRAPGRFPIAYAWPLLRSEGTWTWEHEGLASSVGPAAAIARVLRHAIETVEGGRCDDRAGVLIIPSTLGETARRRLRRAVDAVRCRTELVTRTAAARSLWLGRFDVDGLLPPRDDDPSNRAAVLHLHLGLDEWEAVAFEVTGGSKRRGAVWSSRLPSYGLLMMHQLATRALDVSYRKSSVNRTWELLWCTPWMRWTLSVLAGRASDPPDPLLCLAPHARTPEFVSQQYRYAAQQALGVGIDSPALLSGLLEPIPRFTEVRDWLAGARNALADVRLAGAVVTGAMAVLPHERTSLGEYYLRQVWPKPKRALVEDGNALRFGALADAAAGVGTPV